MDKKTPPNNPQTPGAEPASSAGDPRGFLQRLVAWEAKAPWQPPSAYENSGGTEVILYLVDTLSLWNVMGCITEAHAADLLTLAVQGPASVIQKAPALAGQSLLKASTHRCDLGHSTSQTALTMAGFYLTFTETLMSVGEKGSVRGHWFALLYHLKNGSHTIRPFYAGQPIGRKLNPDEYMGVIVDVIAGDIQGRSPDVSARIHAGGGLKLSPPLKKRVSPTLH